MSRLRDPRQQAVRDARASKNLGPAARLHRRSKMLDQVLSRRCHKFLIPNLLGGHGKIAGIIARSKRGQSDQCAFRELREAVLSAQFEKSDIVLERGYADNRSLVDILQ